jgi:sugar/nucleoside kinase (ribokinase family)
MSLLVVGTVAFDDVETPFGRAEKIIGGAATYISWAASNFVKDISIVSVIGDDFPQEELTALEKRGVNMDGLQVKAGEKSFFWAGRYHSDMNGRDTLATDLNVLADFNPIVPENRKNSDFVMLGNLSPQVQLSVLEQLENKPSLIVLDTMNFWMNHTLDELKVVLQKIDVLTINDEEARQLSGEYSLRKAARVIQAMGPKFLVIKKGEHGALLFHGEFVFFCPALPLEEVFDPTGAGDSFAGGFIGYLAKTQDVSFENMKRAVVYGSAIASFCVERFGVEQLKNVDSKAIHLRVAEFIQLMAFDAPISHIE